MTKPSPKAHLVQATLAIVGEPFGGDLSSIMTREGLETALESTKKQPNVERAWIEGDALFAEIWIEVKDSP